MGKRGLESEEREQEYTPVMTCQRPDPLASEKGASGTFSSHPVDAKEIGELSILKLSVLFILASLTREHTPNQVIDMGDDSLKQGIILGVVIHVIHRIPATATYPVD